MQSETKAVINKKFKKALEAHKKRHKEDLKDLFNVFGITFNRDTLIAYFLGILRAISFDSKAFIESRGLEWDELVTIAKEKKDKILSTARDIEKDC